MKKRDGFPSAVAAGILSVVASGCGSDASPGTADSPRFNVVLVTFCTMRSDHIGAFSGVAGTTPNLDALGSDSIVFHNNYTPGSYSGGGFASILTGLYPFNHGIYDHPLPLEDHHPTLAKALKMADYRTAAFVTHPYTQPGQNFDQGFDRFIGKRTLWQKIAWRLKVLRGEVWDNDAEWKTSGAVRWLKSNHDRRFFLWVELGRTHFPYGSLPPRFEPTEAIVKRAFASFTAKARTVPHGQVQFDYPSVGFTEAETDAALTFYEAEVRYTDHLFGRVLEALKDLDAYENTVIVVTADHGESLGERGIFFNHDANLNEAVAKVPLLIRAPGYRHRSTVSLTRSVDIVPTVLELVGVDEPVGLDGTSLAPLLGGEEKDLTVFSETRPFVEDRSGYRNYPIKVAGVAGKLRMIRRGNYKLIALPEESGTRFELYDLKLDPDELQDLSHERIDLVDELARELEDWFANYEDRDLQEVGVDPDTLRSLQALGYIK